MTGGVTGLELAEIVQQSHVSVTGCNKYLLESLNVNDMSWRARNSQ